MANFCIPKAGVDKFTQALRSGKIDPAKLSQMTSEERRGIFKDIVGENGAKQVNAEFEARTLLKNQKTAYVAWAKKVAGLTPSTRNDLVSQIQKLDKVLNPTEEKAFLKDLASTKLGVNVSVDEAKNIVSLSKKVSDAENGGRSTLEQASQKGFTPSKADLDYGHARYDLENYVGDIKGRPNAVDLKSIKEHPVQSAKQLPRAVADVTKSIGASLDDSFALRQGVKAFWTDNKLWQKEFKQSFINLVKGFKNYKDAEREINSHLMADPYYDQAVKDGLAVRNIRGVDDVFPTTAPGRIPVLGRAFNASETAYSGFADNLRLGIYKQQLKLADGTGEKLPVEVRKNIAKEVNSLTGRGGFGKGEAVAKHLNAAFYSARFMKSNLDTLLLHPTGIGVGGLGSTAQKTAAKNLLKIIAGTASVLATAHALDPKSVEFDPRSSNFGKIKVGSTTFDVGGSMEGIITLASRLAADSTKSESGNVSKLNTGKFGATTKLDVIGQYFEGKTSPIGSVLVDLGKGQTFSGGKVTPKSELGNAGIPLNVQNYAQLKSSKNSANIIASMLADTLGVSTNTETPPKASKSSIPVSDQTNTVLNKVGYKPTIAKSQRDIKLTPQQYSQIKQQTAKTFSQAVAKASKDPTFQKYSVAQKKASLEASLSKAKASAVDKVLPQTKKGNSGYTQYENNKKAKVKSSKVKVFTSATVAGGTNPDAPRTTLTKTGNPVKTDVSSYTPVNTNIPKNKLTLMANSKGQYWFEDAKGNKYAAKHGTPLLQITQNNKLPKAATSHQSFDRPVRMSV